MAARNTSAPGVDFGAIALEVCKTHGSVTMQIFPLQAGSCSDFDDWLAPISSDSQDLEKSMIMGLAPSVLARLAAQVWARPERRWLVSRRRARDRRLRRRRGASLGRGVGELSQLGKRLVVLRTVGDLL